MPDAQITLDRRFTDCWTKRRDLFVAELSELLPPDSKDAAPGLYQDAFVRLHAVPGLTWSGEEPAIALFRAEVRLVGIDWWREATRTKRQPRAVEPNGHLNEAARAILTDEARALLRLRFEDGLTYHQIAERTGQPEAGLREVVRAALATLRQHLRASEVLSFT